jgi:hypothetical protein
LLDREEWEEQVLRKNDSVLETLLLEKYKDLVFHDIDYNITYTVYDGNLEYLKGRGGGWCVIGLPPDYDGDDRV